MSDVEWSGWPSTFDVCHGGGQGCSTCCMFGSVPCMATSAFALRVLLMWAIRSPLRSGSLGVSLLLVSWHIGMPGRFFFFFNSPCLVVSGGLSGTAPFPAPRSGDVSSQFREAFTLPLVHETFPWPVVSVWCDPVLVQLKHCPAPIRIAGLVFKMALDARRGV